jgi:hypothetical protein
MVQTLDVEVRAFYSKYAISISKKKQRNIAK